MAKYKIQFDRANCIGCGACAATCPDFWEMTADGKSKLKGKSEIDDLACNKEAAESCPVNVIHIIETKTGKKII